MSQDPFTFMLMSFIIITVVVIITLLIIGLAGNKKNDHENN